MARDAMDLASDEADVADAATTLLVHAGIAASDVICCARLGEYSRGESHQEAVSLLRSADSGSALHLSTLLELKTRAGYSHVSVTSGELKRAGRAAERLLEVARGLSPAGN